MPTLAIFLFSLFLVGGIYTSALSSALGIEIVFGLLYYSLPAAALGIYVFSARRPLVLGPGRSMKYIYALLLLLAAGVLQSSDKVYGAYKIYEFVRNLVVPVVFIHNVVEGGLWKKLLKYCSTMNIPICFVVIARYFQIHYFDPLLFGNPIGVSQYLSLSNIAVLSNYFTARSRPRGAFLVAAAAMGPAFFVQMISTSRGPLIATVACFLVWLLFFSQTRLFKKALALAAVGCVLVVAAQSASFSTLNKLMKLSAAEGFEAESYDRSAGVRLLLNLDALTQFRDSSLYRHLFGFGTGSFKALGLFTPGDDGEVTEHKYPHNILIELLYENGAVGVLVFLSFFIYVLRVARDTRRSRSSPYYAVAVFGILMTGFGSIVSMFTGSLGQNQWIWMGATLSDHVLRLPSPETTF
jgi:O-antigen ligase